MKAAGHLPTGMFEVVTAVAWDECEGIVMVTIVLVGACVCDTDPEIGGKKVFNNGLSTHTTDSQIPEKSSWEKRILLAFSFSLTEAEKWKINLPLMPHTSLGGRAGLPTYRLWLLKEWCWLPR